MATQSYDLDDLSAWRAVFEAQYHNNDKALTRQDWDQLLISYGAVTDSPCVCSAKDLINADPDAVFVLVERDIDSWYQSFEALITAYYLPIRPVLQYLVPQLIGRTAGTFSYVSKDKKGFFRAGNKTEL